VTLVALTEWWVPRPTFAVEADVRLLTSRSVEARWTRTSTVHGQKINVFQEPDFPKGSEKITRKSQNA